MTIETPFVAAADVEYVPGHKIGDIDSLEKANNAIASLTYRMSKLHDVINSSVRGTEAFRSAVQEMRRAEVMLTFAHDKRHEHGGHSDKDAARANRNRRMINILREAFPDTYKDVVTMYEAAILKSEKTTS